MADLEKSEETSVRSGQPGYSNPKHFDRRSSGNSDDTEVNSGTIHRNSVASSQSLLPSRLSWRTKIGYSFGHVLNDLTGSIWFSYTLLFFQYRFSGSLGGALILLGQIADALSGPFIGYQSDKSGSMWLCARFGRRKTWHFVGVLMNLLSVPLLYNQCLFGCDSAPEYSQFFYYAVLAFINQAGWAASQVTHVSLITDLTSDTGERIALNTYRQAATIASNICLYAVTYFVISSLNDDSNGTEANESTIRKEDLVIFTYISYIVCLIGLVFALLFQVLVREPEQPPKPRKVKLEDTKRYLRSTRGSQGIITLLASQTDEPSAPSSRRASTISYLADPEEFERRLKAAKSNQKRWHHWFKSVSFWKITIMYTFARMFFNVTQVYTPLYLQYFLRLPKRTIAINPFATYFAGLVFSFATKPLSARFGSRITLLVGTVFGVLTSAWIWFGGDTDSFRQYQVYAVAAGLGIAGTCLLISSLALTSDLIGSNTASGAFVFAAMSFFDKSINGLVIALLEQFKPSEESGQHLAPQNYYRLIMVTLTGLPSVMIALLLATLVRTKYGRRSRANSMVSMH